MPVEKANLIDRIIQKMPIDTDGILAFKLTGAVRKRAIELLERNSTTALTFDESLELQKFIALETIMRSMKAKALLKKHKLSNDTRRLQKHG